MLPENRRRTNTRFMNSGYSETYNGMSIGGNRKFYLKKKPHASKSAQYFPESRLKIC